MTDQQHGQETANSILTHWSTIHNDLVQESLRKEALTALPDPPSTKPVEEGVLTVQDRRRAWHDLQKALKALDAAHEKALDELPTLEDVANSYSTGRAAAEVEAEETTLKYRDEVNDLKNQLAEAGVLETTLPDPFLEMRAKLALKKGKVIATTSRVQHDKQHYSGYWYTSSAALMEEVRKPMAEAGLAFTFDLVKAETEDTGRSTKQGSPIMRADVVVRLTLVDTETGYFEETEVPASSFDHDGKEVWQAVPAAVAGWLKHTFLLPTVDPEGAQQQQPKKQQKTTRRKATPKKAQKAGEANPLNALIEAADGFKEATEAARTQFQVDKLQDLAPDQIQALIDGFKQ